MSFEDLDINSSNLEEVKAKLSAKERDLAGIFHRAFVQNPDGKKALDYMVNTTIMRRVLGPHSTQFEAGIREGENQLVRRILMLIQIAENPRGEHEHLSEK